MAIVTPVTSVVPITNRALNISDKFATQCSTVIDSDYDTSGSITRASMAYLTKNQLDAIFSPGGLFADLDAWFQHSIEMKACGVQRFAMYDWIMSNADRTTYRAAVSPGIKTVGGPALIQPFIMGKQQSIVNKAHWKITAGYSSIAAFNAVRPPDVDAMATTYATGGQTYPVQTARVIRVESRYGVPVNEAFFRAMDTLHIFNTKSGLGQHGQWRVIDAQNDLSMTYCYVAIEDMNVGNTEPYDTSPGTANACYMVAGINNVQDWEVWCNNRPTIDPRKRVPFWVQTDRWSRAVDSEYLLVYNRLMQANIAFREFGDLPLAERNKQDELLRQYRFVNDFFYNKPLPFQDLTTWNGKLIGGTQGLDIIQTVDGAGLQLGIGSKTVALRANFIGAREQLRQCGQVFDLAGLTLNWYEWLDLNYALMRARSTYYSKQITDIDWWTNNSMRALIASAYTNYIKNEYPGIPPQLYVQYNQVNKLGMVYDTYSVKYPSGIHINVLSDFWFDDRLDQFNGATGVNQEAAGNLLWAPDIGKPGSGSIYYALLKMNRRTTTTGNINELSKVDKTFACVMETTSIDRTLTSQTGTVIVECPLSSAMIENFSLAIPNTAGKAATISGSGSAGSLSDLYQ